MTKVNVESFINACIEIDRNRQGSPGAETQLLGLNIQIDGRVAPTFPERSSSIPSIAKAAHQCYLEFSNSKVFPLTGEQTIKNIVIVNKEINLILDKIKEGKLVLNRASWFSKKILAKIGFLLRCLVYSHFAEKYLNIFSPERKLERTAAQLESLRVPIYTSLVNANFILRVNTKLAKLSDKYEFSEIYKLEGEDITELAENYDEILRKIEGELKIIEAGIEQDLKEAESWDSIRELRQEQFEVVLENRTLVKIKLEWEKDLVKISEGNYIVKEEFVDELPPPPEIWAYHF